MKASVHRSYGSAEVLKLEEIEKPSPQDDEVLIKVYAAALNPLDWRMLKGLPFIFRAMMKMRLPTAEQPVGIGRDVAGVVEAVGKNATQFAVGDEVFGACTPAVAEYACAKETALVKKPERVTFEQAAAIPVAGYTALQGLRKLGVRPGQKVLVNGASGGVGTFAVQIAKSLGAEVTGVCSATNVEMVSSIGADKVIDYTQEDFTKGQARYDFIFDCISNKSLAECRRVLTPNGKCMMIGAPHDVTMLEIMSFMCKALLSNLFSKQKAVTFMAKSNQADLVLLGEMVADGKVKPVIDSRYSLADTAEAIRYLERGHARGKVVITVSG